MTVENWTRESLEQLLGQEEGSSLEFKRSAALENTDPHKRELVKDITALANAAGGIIVYGIEELNGTASAIDDGVDVAPEWIEQVLDSNAEPKVAGVVVQRIALAEGRYAYAIEVPQATALAPHQSKQHHQYFRRHGRKVLPMLDHEVRDLMRRGSAPHLHFMYRLTHRVDDQFRVDVSIGNKSSAPAEYGNTKLAFDTGLASPDALLEFTVSDLATLPAADGQQQLYRSYSRNFIAPSHLPIFKEQDWAWLSIEVTVQRNSRHSMFYSVACPGFSHTRSGVIVRGEDLVATIEWWDN